MPWPRRTTVLIVAASLSLPSSRVFAQQPEFPPAFPPIRPGAVPLVQMPGAEPGREEELENPFEDAIETDRDSFTSATTTVGRGRLVIESAYSFLDNRGVKETHSFPELLGRYGLTERLELRLGWNYEVGGGGERHIRLRCRDGRITVREGVATRQQAHLRNEVPGHEARRLAARQCCDLASLHADQWHGN
jgi:hypothetical protein